MKDFLFRTLFTIVICVAFGVSLSYGLDRNAEHECKTWQTYATQYAGFYLLPWQADQCKIIGEPVNAKVVGTERPDPEAEFEMIHDAKVSGYSSEKIQNDERPSRMASGRVVYAGAIACPTRYEFGTKIEIDGRVYTCEDRMGARFRGGNYFDIWFASTKEAEAYGLKVLEVKIYQI
jgi:3D (Asp-Asp-Asp) domain-containing protein